MEKLKNIKDILIISFLSIMALVLIDYFMYEKRFVYLYLAVAIVLLVSTAIISIIIYDCHESIEETKLQKLMNSLMNGKSFELEVNKIEYNREKSKAYAKYMRILNGFD